MKWWQPGPVPANWWKGRPWQEYCDEILARMAALGGVYSQRQLAEDWGWEDRKTQKKVRVALKQLEGEERIMRVGAEYRLWPEDDPEQERLRDGAVRLDELLGAKE
jgi:hypothetical protein